MRYSAAPTTAALIFFILTGCGQYPSSTFEVDAAASDAIIDGSNCTSEEFPSAVALVVQATAAVQGQQLPYRSFWCTGTLIAPDVVLTAAHCVDALLLGQRLEQLAGVQLTLVEHRMFITRQADLSGNWASSAHPVPNDAIEATSWVLHPDYITNETTATPGLVQFDDLAVMFLSQEMSGVQPATIITAAEAAGLQPGSNVWVAGWGQQTTQQPGPGEVAVKQCGASVVNEIGDPAWEMQIGNTSTRKCFGDSGGPTYWDVDGTPATRRLVGVTSHAYDQRVCGIGGVDTVVSSYLGWIDSTMSAGCISSTGVWCDVPGILSPAQNSPSGSTTPPTSTGSTPSTSNQPNSGPATSGNNGAAGESEGLMVYGQGCAAGLGLWQPCALLALFMVRRRSNRRRNSRRRETL